jgi:VWFA-related protein
MMKVVMGMRRRLPIFRIRTVLVPCLALGMAQLYGNPPWQLYGDNTPQPEPQMVELNVVALDAKGQPVTDLTRDELRVTDSNKPQTITLFRHRDDALSAPPTLGPNEVSNRGRDNVPRATMILFDLLNERFGTRGGTANRLVHDLESLESADYVYLYCLTLDGRLIPVHGLPGPEEEAQPAGGAPWTRQIKPLMDRAMRSFTQLRPVDEEDPTYRIQLTYAALNVAAGELARAPGRKSLVWLTDGVPIELGPNRTWNGQALDFTPQLRQMTETFDRAGVAIYPARQVMMGSPESMGGPGTTGLGSIDTLAQFAELTGGRPDAGKDIGAAVRQAITDARTSYQIGYFPPESNWDDKFHKLRITCTRKGVKIQAKTGYYAWHEPAGARSQQAIASVIATTFDAAEIGLRASLSRNEKDPRRVRLDAHVDVHDVAFVHEGDSDRAELRYSVMGFAPGSQPLVGPVTPLDLRLSRQDLDKASQEGIAIQQDLSLGAEITRVRLAVFDRGSNAIGSVTIAIPALARRPN